MSQSQSTWTNIETNPKSLFLEGITTTEISKHIDKLPSKNSSGYDMISNILLKRIKASITKPLSIIFNLSLVSGQFLENMKIAEVLSLFKKGEKHLLNNYRPISLLITMSKLLEKCIYSRVYHIFKQK